MTLFLLFHIVNNAVLFIVLTQGFISTADIQRADVPEKYKWDLNPFANYLLIIFLFFPSMFDSPEDWETELHSVLPIVQKISLFKGYLSDSSDNLATALYLRSEVNRKLSLLYTYAHAVKIQDTRDSSAQSMEDTLLALSAQVSANLSWMRPEILSIEPAKLEEMESDGILEEWIRYLDVMTRFRNHSLGSAEESIMSLFNNALNGYQKTYSLLANADLTFPPILVPHANNTNPILTCAELGIGTSLSNSPPELNVTTEPIADALLRRFLQHSVRCVREQAFNSVFSTLERFKNTFVSLLAGHVNSDVLFARMRKFNSSLSASLFDV